VVQILLWVVLGLVALSALSFVFQLGFWLVGVALFALGAYALVDVLFLTEMSLVKRVLWGLGVFFLPPFGPLAWLLVKSNDTKRLLS
jgi:Phospholipase_D-nuclease N-terminal